MHCAWVVGLRNDVRIAARSSDLDEYIIANARFRESGSSKHALHCTRQVTARNLPHRGCSAILPADFEVSAWLNRMAVLAM
jgi:hypothetical protein